MPADVFLSHHVGSMNKYAYQLHDKLQQLSVEPFICTNMKPGDDFRSSITKNAVKCKIFIPFINEEWARSEECISEFNCALRSYNTRKAPQIVPIIIGGFGWIDVDKYPDVYNVTANTNCAVLQGNDWNKVFEEIIGAVKAHPDLSKSAKPTGIAEERVHRNRKPTYVSCSTGDLPPPNAVQGGWDGGPSYHARGPVDGLTVPGKVGVSDTGRSFVGACIPYASKENRVHTFEVLTFDGNTSYVKCKTGDMPPENAVQGGYDGGASYHARGSVDGKTIPGKVGTDKWGKLKGACIPYGGKEHRIHTFEVLVIDC